MQANNLFSDPELQLLFNKEIFYTKRTATEKLYLLFSEIIVALKDTSVHKTFAFPAGTDFSTGKISKGENYKGSPYVILDFPKLFSSRSVFAFRVIFWFGHCFIFSQVAGGNALKSFQQHFLRNKIYLHKKEIFFSTYKDAWQHEVNNKTSCLIENISEREIVTHIRKNNFIKMSTTSVETNKEKIIFTVVKNYELMLRSFL